METNEPTDGEPSDADLAACGLVMELIRSGRILTFVGDVLVERVDEVEFPGEPPEAVVIRRFCRLAVPALAEEDAAALWRAADLVESIRDRIVVDFQLELEGEERRN